MMEEVKQSVLVLHGLGRTSRSMKTITNHIQQAGFNAKAWDYPSMHLTVAELVQHLATRINQHFPHDQPLNFVGHSMGGILSRAVFPYLKMPVKRIVMMGSPNRGAPIVNFIKHIPLLKLMLHKAGHEMARHSPTLKSLPLTDAEIGSIAGTKRFNIIIPATYLTCILYAHHPHDGTVPVACTRFTGMKDFVTVKAQHTFMMNHPDTIKQCIHFLKTGAFNK